MHRGLTDPSGSTEPSKASIADSDGRMTTLRPIASWNRCVISRLSTSSCRALRKKVRPRRTLVTPLPALLYSVSLCLRIQMHRLLVDVMPSLLTALLFSRSLRYFLADSKPPAAALTLSSPFGRSLKGSCKSSSLEAMNFCSSGRSEEEA